MLFLSLAAAAHGQAASAQNVTLRLEWNLSNDAANHTGDGQVTGQALEDSLSFPYLVSETVAPSLFGIVNFGDFINLGYDMTGSTVKANMTQQYDSEDMRSSFLLPFTAGDRHDINRREPNIQGGLFDNQDFLDFPSPNFAYQLTMKKTIRAVLAYSPGAFVIDGPDYTLSSGIHNMLLRNNGTNDNSRLVIAATRQ